MMNNFDEIRDELSNNEIKECQKVFIDFKKVDYVCKAGSIESLLSLLETLKDIDEAEEDEEK